MAGEVPAHSSREDLRRIEGVHALELQHGHRLRIPSAVRLGRADPAYSEGYLHASSEGEEAIVECMDDRGLWRLARVSRASYAAILKAQSEVNW